MDGDKRTIFRSQSHTEATTGRSLPNLGRYLSLVGGPGPRSTCFGTDNPLSKISEEDLTSSREDVREAKSGRPTGPLADSPTNNLDRENRMRKAFVKGVTNGAPLEGKSSLPGPADFSPLGRRTRDADPESLAPNKKPFHQKTWFACTIYGTLMALMLAAILALAFNRSFVMPRMVLKGEVLNRSSVQYFPSSSPLLQSQSPDEVTTPVPTANDPASGGSSLLNLISDAATTTRPEVTTAAAVPAQASGSPVQIQPVRQRGERFEFMLSLPGPLQRFSR